MKHFLVCYIDRVDILSLKVIQIQAYHRKTYVDFNINKSYSSQQKSIFVVQSCKKELLRWFFPILKFDNKLDILPKPMKETLAILKSALKLPITSF